MQPRTSRKGPPGALLGAGGQLLVVGLCMGVPLLGWAQEQKAAAVQNVPRKPSIALQEQSVKAGRWLLTHFLFDTALIGGWRVSWEDPQRTGYFAGSGGAEVNLGLEFAGGFWGILVGSRFMIGKDSTDRGSLEVSGHAGAQLRISDWVRFSAGVTAGRLLLPFVQEESPPDSVFAGGFLRLGVDFWPREDAAVLRAFSLWVRADLAGHPPPVSGMFPRSSVGLSLGLGVRL